MRRSYVSLSRSEELDGASGARGFHLEDRRGPDLLLPAARHFYGRCCVDDRQWLLQAGVPRAAHGVRGRGAKAVGREFGRQRRIGPIRITDGRQMATKTLLTVED